jgi:phosphate/sulfate permease
MSTTHVSTAATAGSARSNLARWNARTLRDFVLARTLTPAVAAVVALAAFGALQQLG